MEIQFDGCFKAALSSQFRLLVATQIDPFNSLHPNFTPLKNHFTHYVVCSIYQRVTRQQIRVNFVLPELLISVFSCINIAFLLFSQNFDGIRFSKIRNALIEMKCLLKRQNTFHDSISILNID